MMLILKNLKAEEDIDTRIKKTEELLENINIVLLESKSKSE